MISSHDELFLNNLKIEEEVWLHRGIKDHCESSVNIHTTHLTEECSQK